MVQEKRKSLRVETLRRLGAFVVRCRCDQLFNASRHPQYHLMCVGEEIDDLIEIADPSVFCSEKCAREELSKRREGSDINDRRYFCIRDHGGGMIEPF